MKHLFLTSARTTHPFVQLLVMVAVALLMFLVASVVTVAVGAAGGDPTSQTGIYLNQTLSQTLMFLLPALFIAHRYYNDDPRSYLRIGGGRTRLEQLAAGVAVFLLLLPLNEWLAAWNDTWELGTLGERLRALQEQSEAILAEMLGTTTIGGLLANLLVAALLPAICEEMFFRAGIQNLLQRWWDPRGCADGTPQGGSHAAVVAAAAIFSLAHAELFSFVPRLLLGLALGYIYMYSGSLMANITAHFVNNALIVTLYWLSARGSIAFNPDEPLLMGWAVTAACTAAAGILFATAFLMPGSTGSAQGGRNSRTKQKKSV